MSNAKRWAFLGLAATLVIAVGYTLIRIEFALTVVPPGLALPEGQLIDSEATALELAVELSKLLMNWTFAIMGAVGLFLKLRLETKIDLGAADLALVFLTIVAAISSLYFAQIAFDVMIRTLHLQQSPLDHDSLFDALRWQFLLLILALSFFGTHIFQYCWRLTQEKKTNA